MYRLQDIINELLQGTAIKKIARTQKISKNTIKRYRGLLDTILESQPEIEDDIDSIMEQFTLLRKQQRYSENFGWLETNDELVNSLSLKCNNYIVLYPKLQEYGFKGSYSSLLRYINKNKEQRAAPVYRIETKPGEYAQVDFGYIGRIYDPASGKKVKAWVFVLVLCFSRHAYYEIVKNQDVQTWCACHIHAFEYFLGVPSVIIPDNLKSGILKASFTDPLINRSYGDLADHYGFQVDPCLPGTPEHKGKVESGVKYVKNNFLPFRRFRDFHDANRQLREWNETVASIRIHGTTREQPIELFHGYEKCALHTVTAERFEIPVYKRLKVYRDIHIQCDYAYYSVPYELRGTYVIARKTAHQVTIYAHEIDLVAVHTVVPPGKRQTHMDHYPPDENNYMKNDTQYCLQKANAIGEYTFAVVKELLHGGPIRNLRSAQNIIRMVKKYTYTRVEAACERAVFFNNYSYASIKRILEKKLDKQGFFYQEEPRRKQLSDYYAYNLKTFLKEITDDGNICSN
jgi:transposase